MNDFNRASGLITNAHTYNAGYEAEKSREALQERLDRAAHENAKAEHERRAAAEAAWVAQQQEVSLRGNEQLRAEAMGIGRQVIHSEDTGAVLSRAEVERTPVKVLGGIEVSYQQAKDMADLGQITKAEFNKAVVDGLALRGYAAPASFR